MGDFDPKQYAREQRRKAYQRAKEARKAYEQKRKDQGLSPEEAAYIARRKEQAKEFRKAAYRAAKKKIQQKPPKKAPPPPEETVPGPSPSVLTLVCVSSDKQESPSLTSIPRGKLRLIQGKSC